MHTICPFVCTTTINVDFAFTKSTDLFGMTHFTSVFVYAEALLVSPFLSD